MDGPKIELKADLTRPIQELTTTIVSATNFIGKVMGPAFEVGGGLVTDQLKHWRAANIERIRDKWIERRKKHGVSQDAIKQLPFDIGVRLFESASLEDKPEVQELWAGLLESGTNPNTGDSIKRVHIEILKSISGIEATILMYLHLSGEGDPDLKYPLLKIREHSIEERIIAIQNLRRQECLRFKLNPELVEGVDDIKNVLATGKSVEKGGLIDVILALKGLIEDVSGNNDRHHLSHRTNDPHFESKFELTELGSSLMRLCLGATSTR